MAYDRCLAGTKLSGTDETMPSSGTPTLRRSKNLPTCSAPNSPVYKTLSTALLRPNTDLIRPDTCVIGTRNRHDRVTEIKMKGAPKRIHEIW